MKAAKPRSPSEAYRFIADEIWQYAPGVPAQSYVSNQELVWKSLRERRVDSCAVALGFCARDELIVASNLLSRREPDGLRWLDLAQAHFEFEHRVSCLEAWLPSRYSASFFRFDLFCACFSLALARGTDAQARWYAQQLYNLRRGGLADLSCAAADYVELHWEMAIALLNEEWPAEQDLQPALGVYRELFLAVGDEGGIERTLRQCAEHHLEVALSLPANDRDESHPYRSREQAHLAYELMGWLALHRRLSGTTGFAPDHPLFLPAVVAPATRQSCADPVLQKLDELAAAQFGQAWPPDDAESYDVLWPAA